MNHISNLHKVIVETMISAVLLCSLASIYLMVPFDFSAKPFSGLVYASSGPVSGAMVIALGPGTGFTMTDASGQYTISQGLKTGTYNVSATAIGYLEAQRQDVNVVAGEVTPNINFNLELSGAISGRITESGTGTPLKGIMVQASESSGSSYGWFAFTDNDGNYVVQTNLATGTYNVSVTFPEGHLSKTIGGISVAAGQEVKNVNLALDKSGVIAGRVTVTPGGEPLAEATVTAFSGTSYFGSAETNATGYYRIESGLETGSYMVMVSYGSYVMPPMVVSVTAGLETTVNLELTINPLETSGTIKGKVIDMNSNPIPNAHVNAHGDTTFSNGNNMTDDEGNYVISTGLETDTYTVTASATGYNEANATGVSVTVGEVTSNVDFQLSEILSGTISGSVQGPPPIPEFPELMTLPLLATTTTLAFIVYKKSYRTRRQ